MERVWVKCIKTVEDPSGRYCIEGRVYEVKQFIKRRTHMMIHAEGNVLLMKLINDSCFIFSDEQGNPIQ